MNIILNKMTLNNYDTFITDSIASKKDIIRMLKINEEKIRVVYPYSKCFAKDKSWEKTDKIPDLPKKYCLYVGDATWNKNLINIARAIKTVNAACVFAGRVFEEKNPLHPWQQELKGFIKESKNDKRFVFPGYVSDSVLTKLYQEASVNLLVSRDEGFGFSYLEASVNSCPTVASNIPVIKEVSSDKALFCDPENYKDIADKIAGPYFNRNLRNRLGRQAFKRSLFFTQEKFRKDFLEAVGG